jgi:hypothetical protein
MMSPEQIRMMQDEAAARAAEEGLVPITIFSNTTAFEDARRAPFIGEHMPEGWEPADGDDFEAVLAPYSRAVFIQKEDGNWPWIFVDSSGWGAPGEPALCGDEMERLFPELAEHATLIDQTIGIAITEVGQFQCHLALYRRVD